MTTFEQRFLRGPNLWSRKPCLLTVLDLGDMAGCITTDLPGFSDDLLDLVPSMRDFAEPMLRGSFLAEVIGQLTLALQRLAGAPPESAYVAAVQGKQGQVKIIVAYGREKVACHAFDVALDVVTHLCAGENIDLDAHLAALEETAQQGAIGASTAMILKAARARGVPAIRASDEAEMFQLGWGSRLVRLHGGIAGHSAHAGVLAAADPALSAALLRQAGIAMPTAAAAGTPACRVLVAGGRVAAASLNITQDVVGDVAPLLHPSIAEACVRAAGAVGLDIASVDVACADIGQPLQAQRGGITGVHAAPELDAIGGEAVVQALFGDGDGRIPLIAVTGTNGKTTTSLMIEHCARSAGLATGVTTTEGVYIKGRRIIDGDCAGFHSARVLLTSPEVEFAVVETARGGILKRGLAFDHCAVGVVLNVAADHLGMDGIETIAELARVKAVVALSASRAVVLNADDKYCVAMARMPAPQVERIWFSMDPDNHILLRHLEQHGRAAWFQDGALIVDDGRLRSDLLAANAMPAAMQGHARYNIANGLAAAAALMGAGFTNAQISSGLASFVSDAGTNPLRSNVYEAGGVTIVVDYAHNPAAYAALAGMARSLARGRRVAVITCPGDRRASDLRDIGATCAAGFDELFVYEADPRGRAGGETAGIILEGARETGKAESLLHAIVAVGEAFDAAMARCVPGDVMVFACGCAATAQLHMARYADAAQASQSGATTG